MKNLFLLFLLISCCQKPFAQNVENASFDSLYIGAINRVWNWTSSDAHQIRSYQEGDTMLALEPNYTFEYAQEVHWSVNSIWETPYSDAGISLQTIPDLLKEDGTAFETYLLNGSYFKTGADGYIDMRKCGTPFPYRPTMLKGFYQFIDNEPMTTDYGKCIVLLKKYNETSATIDTIGIAKSTMDLSVTTDWEAFEIPIDYFSNEIPDSVVLAFYAGTNPDEEQELLLDDLSFDFTTSIYDTRIIARNPTIFPNPNSGRLFIQPHDRDIKLFQLWSSTGEQLKSGHFSNTIDLEGVASQLLILKLISTDDQVFTYKILKN